MLNLIVTSGQDRGRVYRLHDKKPHRIGRLNGAFSICLSDSSVSRVHAEVMSCDSQWAIKDTHSTNGTFVNDRRVMGQSPLNNGDHLRIGRTTFVVDVPTARANNETGHIWATVGKGTINNDRPIKASTLTGGWRRSPSKAAALPDPASYPGTQPDAELTSVASGLIGPVGWTLMVLTLLAMLVLLVDVYRHPY